MTTERQYCGFAVNGRPYFITSFPRVLTLDLLILTGGSLLHSTGSLSANRIRAQLKVRRSQTLHVWNSIEPERSGVILNHSQHRPKTHEAPQVTTQQHQQGQRLRKNINREKTERLKDLTMMKTLIYSCMS